jgi:hypothetical protein
LALILLFMMARGSISEDLDSFDPDFSDWLLVGISAIAVGGLIFYITKYSKGWKNNRQAEQLQKGLEKSQLDDQG